MADIYRVLVTGSRDWADAAWLSLQLGMACGDAKRAGKQPVVVHGACPTGADRLADQIAADHGIEREAHPADWEAPCRPECKPGHRRKRRDGSEYCPSAGHYRNQEMADLGAGVCLAFFKSGAANSGTSDCVRRARAAGIRVREFHDCVKVSYPDRLAAKMALASATRPGARRDGGERRIYWCEQHRAYHLTSQGRGRK